MTSFGALAPWLADVLVILGVVLTVGVALHAWNWVVWIGTKLHLFGGGSD